MAEVPVYLSASNEEIGMFAQARFARLAGLMIARGGQTAEKSMALPPEKEDGLGVILNGIAGTALYPLDDMTDLTLMADHSGALGDTGYQTSGVSAEIMYMSEPVEGAGTVDEFETFEVGLQDGVSNTCHETGIVAMDKDGNGIADDLSELVGLLSTLDKLKQEQPNNLAVGVLIGNVNRRLSRAMIEHDDLTPFTYEHYRKIMKVLRQAASSAGFGDNQP